MKEEATHLPVEGEAHKEQGVLICPMCSVSVNAHGWKIMAKCLPLPKYVYKKLLSTKKELFGKKHVCGWKMCRSLPK